MYEMILFKLFDGATVLFEAFIVYQYINSLFEEKDFLFKKVYGYTIFTVGLITASLFFNIPLLLSLYTILMVFVLESLFYKASLLNRISSTLFFIIIMIGSENLCISIIHMLGGVNFESTANPGTVRMLAIVIAKLLQVLFVKVFGMLVKWKRHKQSKFEIKQAIPLFFCQIFSIILSHQIFVFSYEVYKQLDFVILLSIFGIMYINMIVFWYFDRIKAIFEYKNMNEAAEIQLRYQAKYYEMLETHQSETNAVWHDMKNHMILIKELLDKKQNSDTDEYVKELETQITSIPRVIKTSNPILSALLTEKVHDAKRNGVEIELDVKVGDTLKITPLDICVVIGNALDNAIEASQLLESQVERCVSISIVQKGVSLIIGIKNSFDPNVIRPPRSGKHGYGLKNIRKVAEKYGGEVSIVKKDNVHRLTIIGRVEK